MNSRYPEKMWREHRHVKLKARPGKTYNTITVKVNCFQSHNKYFPRFFATKLDPGQALGGKFWRFRFHETRTDHTLIEVGDKAKARCATTSVISKDNKRQSTRSIAYQLHCYHTSLLPTISSPQTIALHCIALHCISEGFYWHHKYCNRSRTANR